MSFYASVILFLSLVASGVVAVASATTKNVDIVVTHGDGAAVVATETFQNGGSSTLPAGSPVILGQAFRRGDVPAGNCVKPRNGTTHADLTHYQFDEVSSRIENSDDGSLRHLVYSVQYDAAVANGATGKVEWVLTGAPCPTGTQKQALSAFTSTHDLKIDFTDVRNQDGSVRNTGHMVWSANRHALNTGRDAPRKYATGGVRDGWIVTGPPEYVTGGGTFTGQKDPLILVTCYFDLFTNPSDQTSLGKIRHVCRVDNPWVQVAAGSPGISGAPGPAGFTNDPQGIFYRPEVFDGATSILDWSRLDRSVTAASNPINTSTGAWTIPNTNMNADTGQSWFLSAPFCVTTSGTLPTGFSNVTPCGSGGTGRLVFTEPDLPAYNTDKVTLLATPYQNVARYVPGDLGAPSNQGTGTHTFNYRTFQPKFQSWYTLSLDGLENWLDGGSNQKRPIYPAWTSAEKLYWEQTGVVPPIDLAQTPDPGGVLSHSQWLSYGYNPISDVSVTGGSGTGARPDIGILNEFDSRALILNTPTAWDQSRSYALGNYPYRFILNEATGRTLVMNNGPPVGPGGNGVGGNYNSIGMGDAFPHAFFQSNESPGTRSNQFASPLENTPVNFRIYTGASFGGGHGWSNDHLPNFVDLQYAAFGSRHYLDTIYFDAARVMAQNFPDYNADPYRDNTIGGNHYWALVYSQDEQRAGYWSLREFIKCSMFGANTNPESIVCNDYLKENSNYWAVYQPWKDGPGSTGYTDGPWMPGSTADFLSGGFMYFYGAATNYMGCAALKDPLSCNVMATHATRFAIAMGGDIPGGMCSYYSNTALYQIQTSLKLPNHNLRGPNVGSQYDSSTIAYKTTGNFALGFNAGSPDIQMTSAAYEPLLTNGDKYLHVYWSGQFSANPASVIFNGPDELATPGVLYTISNVNHSVSPTTFRLICPVGTTPSATCPTPGAPFTGYTFNGSPYSQFSNVIGQIAFQTCPSKSYDNGDGGYEIYTASIAALAKILGHGSVSFLGKTLNDAYNTYFNVRGTSSAPRETALKMNGNVVVP